MMNTPEELSKRLLEVLPPIVQKLRAEARVAVKGKITMPQFRILANIKQGFMTVSAIAENQMVAQPTASKMIDGLVNRGFIKRVASKDDRRKIHLELSKKGMTTFLECRGQVQKQMSNNMKTLTSDEREKLATALNYFESILVAKTT